MNASDRASTRYWQVMPGSEGRDYSSVFLRYGIAFGGTGAAAMSSVKPGDRIVLKRGKSRILAVGEIVERGGRVCGCGDKAWLMDFDGWQLSNYCYVEWHIPKTPVDTRGLTRATFQRVNKTHLQELAERILREVSACKDIKREPRPTKKVEDSEILDQLVWSGLRPAAAEELTTALRRIRLLANYYYSYCWWGDVREHETRSFLILPLLLALGWPEQQIKVELGAGAGKVDIACFSQPYYRHERTEEPNDRDCVLILESKGFSQGLDFAPDQARVYARQFPKCKVIVASNGFCYKAYKRRKEGVFDPELSAYLNLLNPQDRYPLDPKVKGCLEVLTLLLPSTWTR